jgi:hypothetical protein
MSIFSNSRVEILCIVAHERWRFVKMQVRQAALLSWVVCALAVGAASEGAQPAAQSADPWTPFRFMLGTWDTTSSGQPGNGTGTREYRLVLDDRFIESRTRVTYPPQDKNPKGEVHEDIGLISFDRGRKAFVMRQFHKEGFVNTYAGNSDNPIVFTTEAIENIPAGFRARETYRIVSATEFVEVFELAEPGKDFAIYSETRLKKRR